MFCFARVNFVFSLIILDCIPVAVEMRSKFPGQLIPLIKFIQMYFNVKSMRYSKFIVSLYICQLLLTILFTRLTTIEFFGFISSCFLISSLCMFHPHFVEMLPSRPLYPHPLVFFNCTNLRYWCAIQSQNFQPQATHISVNQNCFEVTSHIAVESFLIAKKNRRSSQDFFHCHEVPTNYRCNDAWLLHV